MRIDVTLRNTYFFSIVRVGISGLWCRSFVDGSRWYQLSGWLRCALGATLKLASETRGHESLSRHYVIAARKSGSKAAKRWMDSGEIRAMHPRLFNLWTWDSCNLFSNSSWTLLFLTCFNARLQIWTVFSTCKDFSVRLKEAFAVWSRLHRSRCQVSWTLPWVMAAQITGSLISSSYWHLRHVQSGKTSGELRREY